jgi:hypothetical protein
MLTTAENLPPPPPPPPPPTADDDTLYHSDDVGLRDTPPLEPKKVNLQPSPSPPLILPDQDTSDSSPDPPDRKRPLRPKKKRGSQGDALLVHVMDGGKRPDIARLAGQELLASEEDEGEAVTRAVTSVDLKKDVDNLAAIAAGALAHQGHAARDPRERAATLGARENGPGSHLQPAGGEPMEGLKPSIPSLSSSYGGDARRPPSPDVSVKSEIMATPTASGLPPIRQHSPKSHLPNGNGLTPITLPSISSQLGDLNHLAEAAATGDSPYPASPSARHPHRYSTVPGHGSPPKSPNDAFRRGLPSPGNYYYNTGNLQRIQPVDGHYNGSNAETPTPDHPGSAPALAIDRMSIDGITNPQIGGFQCTYPNCTAQPFQTQVSWTPRRERRSGS